ncbi:MAG: metal-sulfur cluster biosynthetic enzyme [Yoonia sp.]|jgi:metal-sulfur cluster biosynthetic enzyme
MHGRATYLLFYGNPNAELPRYTTDLRTQGEGYGLAVENVHYTAQLSRQMGQLERMTLKRAEGLELFAGGTGHGEPPTIDWSCDYVDEDGLQKLRIRSWSECPNFEVTKGPLAVRVRRWGFPHSPLHPVFAPARMHIDQTYTFYAGQSWFFREGSMDVISDLQIKAMRDDEWVFSGYSFTDSVWIDREGKLYEGSVKRGEEDDMWGVGLFHRDSREAFIALRLEHSAKGFDDLKHGGRPDLDYPHHGQLWARYPVRDTRLSAGTSFHQKNAYSVAPYPETGGPQAFETLRHRLLNSVEIQPGDPPRHARAQSRGALARQGETTATAPLKSAIWKLLREVRDEQLYHINGNIVDLGYVYDLRVLDGGIVEILVTMPHRGRPVYQFLVKNGGGRVEEGIRDRLIKLNGIREVIVKFTWDPPWTTARLTAVGRRELDLG